MKSKKTKIIATIGPSIASLENIKKATEAGARIFRQNFSHGTNEERLKEIKWVQKTAEKMGVRVALMQDLQGPKIRLGKLKSNCYAVKKNDEIGLTYGIKHDGGPNLPIQHDIADLVKSGDEISLFDGTVKGKIVKVAGKIVIIKILNDGLLLNNKGVNLPDAKFETGSALTEEDEKNIKWGTNKGYKYVALSFAQTAGDVEYLRKILRAHGSKAKVIVKLETKTAVSKKNLEEIIKASDGVMVARGDMAAEIGAEKVPSTQQEILKLCKKHEKFTIVATHMLASMTEKPFPTRAELQDVASAVMGGADMVMLSEETASGKFPIEAIEMMQKTINFTEKNGI